MMTLQQKREWDARVEHRKALEALLADNDTPENREYVRLELHKLLYEWQAVIDFEEESLPC